MMDESRKRKTDGPPGQEPMDKKKKKQWQMPKKKFSWPQIEPGDAGIWVTCDMHKEGLCTVELKDFFNECATSFYGDSTTDGVSAEAKGRDSNDDIEAEINKEVKGMQDSEQEALFAPVKLDIPCVLFFKTREPVEPVTFVQRVCEEAMTGEARRTTRFVKRLTPMARMGKATEKNLEDVAKAVLAPVFHAEGTVAQKVGSSTKLISGYNYHLPDDCRKPPMQLSRRGHLANMIERQFAIRTTIRNNHAMKRDDIIKRVADLVGGPHTVDLNNYNQLILVDVYRVSASPTSAPVVVYTSITAAANDLDQNVLGMSIVGPDHEKLKRFNLAEIYDASGAISED
ncbi:MAG: hypothetical protein Q9218_004735 [Villophora microphyllina]